MRRDLSYRLEMGIHDRWIARKFLLLDLRFKWEEMVVFSRLLLCRRKEIWLVITLVLSKERFDLLGQGFVSSSFNLRMSRALPLRPFLVCLHDVLLLFLLPDRKNVV